MQIPLKVDQNKISQGANSILAGRDVIQAPRSISRLEKLFELLSSEISDDMKKAEVSEALTEFIVTDSDHVIGLEGKLSEADLTDFLEFAKYTKECITKKLATYQHYASAQKIFALLFSMVISKYHAKVAPILIQGTCEAVPTLLYDHIVQEISDELDQKCPAESDLEFNQNEIYGLIYFLAGKCKLRFKH